MNAVSEETAVQMAEGAAKAAHAEVALSTTGIAGPDGGTPEKPVGLVYIGCVCFEAVLSGVRAALPRCRSYRSAASGSH